MTRAEHVLVAGPSGGGKSTYLREMHARHDGASVFLTTKSGERSAHHRPPERVRQSSAHYPRDLERARDWAVQRDELVQVIVDEAQNAPTFAAGDDGPCRTMLHEDREAGVKAVVATQNPQDLRTGQFKYGPIQQCEYWVFVGPAKDWHVAFFQANNMADLVPLLPTERFEYVVLNPVAALSAEEKVVARGQTDPRFG